MSQYNKIKIQLFNQNTTYILQLPVGIAACNGLDRLRKSNSSGGVIFHAMQASPPTHPASCTSCTRSFPRVKGLVCGADHPLFLAPRLQMGCSYISTSPLFLHKHVMGWRTYFSHMALPSRCFLHVCV